MSDPVFTLTVTNVEVLPNVGELANVAVKIAYEWTATPDVGNARSWPGVVELGPADPEYFTDLSTLDAPGVQTVVGEWVHLELGRERIRKAKAEMTVVLAAQAIPTVPFQLPEE
jgi:hypothetical protein